MVLNEKKEELGLSIASSQGAELNKAKCKLSFKHVFKSDCFLRDFNTCQSVNLPLKHFAELQPDSVTVVDRSNAKKRKGSEQIPPLHSEHHFAAEWVRCGFALLAAPIAALSTPSMGKVRRGGG